MGQRALVVFVNNKITEKKITFNMSPTIYLHWDGDNVMKWIPDLEELMSDRKGDVEYAAARFIGIAHERIHGNLSLGVWNNDSEEMKNWDESDWAKYSHGDNGVFWVDVTDFTVFNLSWDTGHQWKQVK